MCEKRIVGVECCVILVCCVKNQAEFECDYRYRFSGQQGIGKISQEDFDAATFLDALCVFEEWLTVSSTADTALALDVDDCSR